MGVREGGVKEWNQVYDKYKSTNIASEKAILLTSLTCTRNPKFLFKIISSCVYNKALLFNHLRIPGACKGSQKNRLF